MNTLLKTSLTCAVVSTLIPATGQDVEAKSRQKKPNVLILCVDDLGYRDLSLTGSPLYETRNIDQLAAVSVNFDQGYVAYPRSVPSRFSLMTGMHCARPQGRQMTDNRHVGPQNYCIAMPFQQAGYETFIIGKWHLNDGDTTPLQKGFDINIGAGTAGATSRYFAPFNKTDLKSQDLRIYGMDDAEPGEYLTDYMTRKTVDYLNAASQKDEPFFAMCCYYAVHTPIQAPEELTQKYRDKIRRMGLGNDPMKLEEAGVVKTQQDHPVYAAMIESVDNSVGRIIQTLKETGMYDNTIIVFLSDHGGLSNKGLKNKRELATSNAPFKAGKGHLYEGGIHVPYLIHMPGQKKSRNCDVPVVSYDLLPTLTDLCGVSVDPKAQLDGVSLRPLLVNSRHASIQERDLFWHKASQRPVSTGDYVATAVRSGKYKLLDFYMQKRVELYDLEKDPGETTNIAAEHPDIVQEMMDKIEFWRKDFRVNMAHPDYIEFTDAGNYMRERSQN